jgi:hypothetical protein
MDELSSLHPDHVFLRREALAFGYTDRDLHAAVMAGVLSKVRHGAYVPASVWAAADHLEQHRLRSHAVLRSHDSALALSHTSAAVEHGLRLHKPELSKVHVTCLGKPLARTTHDIVYHEREQDLEVSSTPHGVLLVDPTRAALQTASMSSVAAGMVVLDSVIDLDKATLDDVHAAHSTFRGPGSRRLHVTVRLVREGANSVGESLGRHLCWSQHLPEPHLQFEVYDDAGNLIGRTDFAWPDFGLLGEFDGLVKYGRLRRPGETVEQAVVREKQREDQLRELTGWLMIRIIWAELFRPTHTARRIQEQLSRGRRLLAS